MKKQLKDLQIGDAVVGAGVVTHVDTFIGWQTGNVYVDTNPSSGLNGHGNTWVEVVSP